MSTVEKRCTVCGDDVANKKRVKDPKGNYFCDPCYQNKRAAKAPTPVGAGASAAGHAALDVAPSMPSNDDLLDLAPVKEAPKENMFGCSSCKKLVPERLIRNIDGEFVCKPCVSKREGATKLKPAKTAMPSRKDANPEEEENRERWSDSLTGGAVISGIVLAAAFFIFFVMGMKWPASKFFTGPGAAALYAAISTIFLVLRTAGLLASMLLAARILGGISFGYFGPVLYKSIAFLTAFTVLETFMEHSEGLAMLGYGFKGILLIVGFVVVFKIDFFEAMLLSVVNFFLNFALAIALGILLLSASNWFSGHSNPDYDDEDFRPGMKHVAPADEDDKAPAAEPAMQE